MQLADYAELSTRLLNTAATERDHDRLVDLPDLRALVADNPRWVALSAAHDVGLLRELRSVLQSVFEDAAAGRPRRAVDRLNALLSRSSVRPQLVTHDGSLHFHLAEQPTSVAASYGSAAAMGLAVVLTEHGMDRLGSCQAGGCEHVFLDTSTNRSRRYCSERCATRENVAAHRARRRAHA